MEKMRMESIDMTAHNIDRIAELFPNCITEALDEEHSTPEHKMYKKVVNFELLKQMLSCEVLDGDEAYEFTWVGKKSAIVEANKPIRKTLRPCPEESVDWDTTENLYIEGDNLEVLKLLQESYLGKIKLIYIDPPYNTGNDFIYADDFTKTREAYEEEAGFFSEDGNKLFKNTDSNGRFHSDWCSMIYSRLLMSRNLLSNDGVILISIDDNEQKNLRAICDEIFGESNFISQFVIASNSAKNNSLYVSISHEYALCYAKEKANLLANWSVARNNIDEYKKRAKMLLDSGMSDDEIHKELLALTKYPRFFEFDHYTYVDRRGPFRASDLTAPGSKSFYDVIHPTTKKPCKTGTRGWAYSEESLKQLISEDRIYFGKDETVMPQLKNYLFENERTLPRSVLFFDSQSSTKWMKANQFGFDFPKATDYIEYLLCMYPSKDCIIMDFFSGSGTTAHAVMHLNFEDGGTRKFIMVQLPEKTDENSIANESGSNTIADIGKERIRRAGTKIKEDNPTTTQNLDTGFRVFKLADSNMNDVYYSAGEYTQDLLTMLESNVKNDRNDLDLLFGCLLEWGIPLSMPYSSEVIAGCMVHTYNDGDLIACFDENIPDSVVKEIARRQPLRAVFRDSSFNGSPSKINVGEIFKMLAPDTRVKVI